jgi:hypothetical protein
VPGDALCQKMAPARSLPVGAGAPPGTALRIFGEMSAETADGAGAVTTSNGRSERPAARAWDTDARMAASSLMPTNCYHKAIVRPAVADRPYEDLRMFKGIRRMFRGCP